MTTRSWTYPSSSTLNVYTVTLAADGLLGCNCKGWTMKRGDKPRNCKHTKDVILKTGCLVDIREGYVYVKDTDDQGLTPTPDIATINVSGGDDDMATMTAAPAVFEGMKASAMVEGKFGHLLNAAGFIIPEKFDATFGTGAWAMDQKLDGHRCQILKVGDSVTTTLKSTPLTAAILDTFRAIPFDLHVDGELCIPGGISTDVPNLALHEQKRFLAFDLISVMGQDIMDLPQVERRAMLEQVAGHLTGDAVNVVAQFDATWANVQAIWAADGEGCILKKKNSPYRPGYRGPEWLKVKRLEQHTVTVTGFEAGSFGPTAVTAFVFDDGKKGTCKTLNQDEIRATAADPASFIGRKLVIQCQQRTRSGAGRHMMWDHWAGEAE